MLKRICDKYVTGVYHIISSKQHCNIIVFPDRFKDPDVLSDSSRQCRGLRPGSFSSDSQQLADISQIKWCKDWFLRKQQGR